MKPQHFALRSSRLMVVALSAIHGAAGAALMLSALPAWAKAMLILLVCINLFFQLRRHAWLAAAEAIVALTLAQDGVMLFRRDGGQLPARLLGDSTVTASLCVLNVLPQGKRFPRSIVVLPDSLDANSLRQLRAGLRWGVQRGTWFGGVRMVGNAFGSV